MKTIHCPRCNQPVEYTAPLPCSTMYEPPRTGITPATVSVYFAEVKVDHACPETASGVTA